LEYLVGNFATAINSNPKSLTKLKTLKLIKSPKVSDDDIESFANHLPSLETLEVSNCSGLTEKSLESFAKMKTLKTLVASGGLKHFGLVEKSEITKRLEKEFGGVVQFSTSWSAS
jgi:hypothetical protein